MATDYLELNREVLEALKESDPVKYRSLKRYLECHNIYVETGDWDQAAAHWNAWAEKLLVERKKLEESGEWQAGFFRIAENQPTKDWLDAAEVDFSHVHFHKKNDEDAVDGEKAASGKDRYSVVVKTLSFKRFTFPFDASFVRTTFSGDAWFGGAMFSGDTWFGEATFSSNADFEKASFCGNVWFLGATFGGDAAFFKVTFSGSAVFLKATFNGIVSFLGATFNGDANFHFVQFEQPVVFERARFGQEAIFSSIRSEKGFSLHGALFRIVPDFNEAVFHAPPVLDDVKIEGQLIEQKKLLSLSRPCKIELYFKHVPEPEQNTKRISRNFRALGKMAHEARDWLNEMEFFAQEIRTRRFGKDFPLGEYRVLRSLGTWLAHKCRLRFLRPLVLKLRRKAKSSPWRGPNPGRFWFGLIYEKASNFGRSFVRPLASWAVTTALFAVLYVVLACEWGGWNWWDALYLSVRHGLVVGGLVRTGHMQQVIEAMFGEMGSGLALLMMGQTLVSAFFLFLFFLAVRNHFRIR